MSLPIQLSGFVAVGAIATMFQYGLMATLINFFDVSTVLASTLSYAVSALLNYGLNRYLVFRSQVRHVDALPRFVATVLIGLLLNAGLMYLALAVLPFHWLFAQVLVTLTVMVSNFLLSKYWVFYTGKTPIGG
ncbi:MAG: GtrA family protein [Thiothrix sp.]|uniref:GtrA family protein n=1 Tax=Thiothrix sp. TaxID=1032 RepID=UPI00261AB3E1|nr:GtrA family protein [Thiothrix sp.]MDD5395602.1 GtrA family protein [Thiothrix sp.]